MLPERNNTQWFQMVLVRARHCWEIAHVAKISKTQWFHMVVFRARHWSEAPYVAKTK